MEEGKNCSRMVINTRGSIVEENLMAMGSMSGLTVTSTRASSKMALGRAKGN